MAFAAVWFGLRTGNSPDLLSPHDEDLVQGLGRQLIQLFTCGVTYHGSPPVQVGISVPYCTGTCHMAQLELGSQSTFYRKEVLYRYEDVTVRISDARRP